MLILRNKSFSFFDKIKNWTKDYNEKHGVKYQSTNTQEIDPLVERFREEYNKIVKPLGEDYKTLENLQRDVFIDDFGPCFPCVVTGEPWYKGLMATFSDPQRDYMDVDYYFKNGQVIRETPNGSTYIKPEDFHRVLKDDLKKCLDECRKGLLDELQLQSAYTNEDLLRFRQVATVVIPRLLRKLK